MTVLLAPARTSGAESKRPRVATGRARRDRGRDLPWGTFCLNAIGTASLLIAGAYALVTPCAPWVVTLVLSLFHAAGVGIYAWLLSVDVRRKLLQSRDGLARAVRIREAFAK